MKKYIYLLITVYSFLTFMAGFNDMKADGFSLFNVGLMALTPLCGLLIGVIYIKTNE